MKAVIFIGHGSKTADGNQQFIHFIQGIFKKMDTPLMGYGFLENAEPSVFQSLVEVIGSGATDITVVPVLLLPGVHANHDIPAEIALIKKKYSSVVIQYSPPIGIHNLIINILIDRLTEKGHRNEEVLLIGHGSRINKADNMLRNLAEMLQNQIECPVDVGYITTIPSYKSVLKHKKERLFVIPYLLFSGRIMTSLKKEIGNHELCNPIGLDQRLIEILKERVQQAKVI
jgi:sirohydrochlorin ferrochelatase